ncbi:MAG TPA: F0F1 ATP synthase subunit alpha [Candidatus Paceibacterota bacterium]
MNYIVEKIKKEIEHFEPSVTTEEIGKVVSVGDGIAIIEGLEKAAMMEMVLFDESVGKPLSKALAQTEPLYGMLLNLEENAVKAVILGDVARVYEGMQVKRLGKVLSINVSDSMLGRVVNALGESVDGKGEIGKGETRPLERIAYGVIDRSPVNAPLQTGIKAIDATIPIGRGQRELIIGDRGIGKTTIAIDTILNQKSIPEATRPICIYVAIGQKESKTARLVHELATRGALPYSIIVTASAAEAAALQFLAPFTGATIGEYFMEKGKDALVVYDDLSKHAVAYRQLSLLLRRPPGREAYPGDIFYLHSRLLERAAKLSKERGGGSLTALPIIETQEGDVSAYIPTNVISITDGQIFLDTDLFNKGMKPAVNVGLSVSRVGSAAQTKAMKKVAGRIKLELAQFRELEAFMQFSSDLDKETRERIEKGERLSQLLTQQKHEPLPMAHQVASIYAGVNGMFDTTPLLKLSETEKQLLKYLQNNHADILARIAETGDLAADTESSLKQAIQTFFSSRT